MRRWILFVEIIALPSLEHHTTSLVLFSNSTAEKPSLRSTFGSHWSTSIYCTNTLSQPWPTCCICCWHKRLGILRIEFSAKSEIYWAIHGLLEDQALFTISKAFLQRFTLLYEIFLDFDLGLYNDLFLFLNHFVGIDFSKACHHF